MTHDTPKNRVRWHHHCACACTKVERSVGRARGSDCRTTTAMTRLRPCPEQTNVHRGRERCSLGRERGCDAQGFTKAVTQEGGRAMLLSPIRTNCASANPTFPPSRAPTSVSHVVSATGGAPAPRSRCRRSTGSRRPSHSADLSHVSRTVASVRTVFGS